jgi:hypothetical protein
MFRVCLSCCGVCLRSAGCCSASVGKSLCTGYVCCLCTSSFFGFAEFLFVFFFLRTWMLFLWLESMILIMDLWRPFRLSGSCICLVIFTCWFPNLSRFQLLEVCLFSSSSSSFLLLLCFLRHWFIVLGDYFGWFCDVCLHMAWYCLGILLFFHVFFFMLHFAFASVRSFWSSIRGSSSLERLFWCLAMHWPHHLAGLFTMSFMFV